MASNFWDPTRNAMNNPYYQTNYQYSPYNLPQGFDVRQGSQDPTVNRAVYGTNYFPGTVPGFEDVKNRDQFFALSPEKQGDYRTALHQQNMEQNRVNPFYLPENWDYHSSPEYQWRLDQALKEANRTNLALGRANSTFGMNAMNRVAADIAGQEVDKQYQRALNANMTNYQRMLGANIENYNRITGESATDWARNWQLAQMGLGATTQGVTSGNAMAGSLANLFQTHGMQDAALALLNGSTNADFITQLLNSGFTMQAINDLFKAKKPGTTASSVPNTTAAGRIDARGTGGVSSERTPIFV